MFSGIVSEVGKIVSLETSAQHARIRVHASLFAEQASVEAGSANSGESSVRVGDSIAHSGVCLTVVEIDPDEGIAHFDICSETLRCTTLGSATEGTEVNLERSLRFGDRLDGHMVQGHVDCIGEVLRSEDQDSTRRFDFSMPRSFAPLVAPKGAICVDGVSLTVGEVSDTSFSVYVIPHTLRETTIRSLGLGGKVNLEADCVARYVARILGSGAN